MFLQTNILRHGISGNMMLAECEVQVLTLLRALKKRPVFFQTLIHGNDLRSSKKLHNQAGSDDWANAKLHQSAAIGSENDTHPEEK